MKVFIISKRLNVRASGEYNPATKELIVKEGSTVSSSITDSKAFRGRNNIVKMRDAHVNNGVVVRDVAFKSSSTAANFITGNSTNGLVAWKTESGDTIAKAIKQAGEKNAQQ